MLRKILAKLL
uniref:Uncharacterized protein n=1 Tax=Rhizophora mucronata TaxID=61149 RepID=A0A2P2NAU3_RHIMU